MAADAAAHNAGWLEGAPKGRLAPAPGDREALDPARSVLEGREALEGIRPLPQTLTGGSV